LSPRRLAPDDPRRHAVLHLIRDAFAYVKGRIDPPSSAHRLTVEAMAAQAGFGAVRIGEDAGRDAGPYSARAARARALWPEISVEPRETAAVP
jgi:hypothetical protein